MPYFASIRQDEYPATDELQCIPVYIPAGDEYRALLAGFLALLTDVRNYEDPESAQAEGIASVFDDAYTQINWDGCGVPPECDQMNSSIILFPDLSSVSNGAAFIWVSDTASSLGGYYTQQPAATDDQCRWYFYLAPGRYAFYMFYLRNTNNGRGDLKVYDTTAALISTTAIDMRGAVQRNTISTGSFDLPEGGRIHIDWDGTGSSGAGFIRPMQRIWIEKYDDL